MKNIFYLIILMFFLLSCMDKHTSHQNKIKNNHTDIQNNILNKNILQNNFTKKSKIDLSISVSNIKSQIDHFTSGFMDRKSASIFINKPKRNYFSFYYLIKGNKKVVGKLIVYDDKNPYTFEKNTDEFIEINIWDKGIKITSNNIEIGIPKDSLVNILGNDFQQINSTIFWEQDSLKAFFKLNNDTVSHIKIGLYKKNIPINDILKTEW